MGEKKKYAMLLKKLRTLHASDKKFSVFGSNGHGYKLGKPLSWEQINPLEKKLKTSLPEEYKYFLKYAGSGGAGPYYGLIPLQENIEDQEIKKLASKSFWAPPSYKEVMRLFEKVRQRNYKKGHLKNYAKNKKEDAIFFPAPGILPLCSEGCGYYTGLVLNGKEKGNMWAYVDVGWIPLNKKNSYAYHDESGDLLGVEDKNSSDDYPSYYHYLLSAENKERIGFYDWYNTWLDNALAQIDGYIYPNKGVKNFKLYDTLETTISRVQKGYKIYENEGEKRIETKNMIFHFRKEVGYRLTRIDIVNDFKGHLSFDKKVVTTFHLGADLGKIGDIRIKKEAKNSYFLPDHPGSQFEVENDKISKISVFKEKKTENPDDKRYLLEKWIYVITKEIIEGKFDLDRARTTLEAMAKKRASVKSDRISKQLQKLTSQKNKPIGTLAEEIVMFFNDSPAKAWWNELTEEWQEIFKYILKIRKEPNQKDTEKMLKLEELECRTDNIRSQKLKNLEPLKALTKLEKIICSNMDISNLEPLKNLIRLKMLDCSVNPIKSLSPLYKLSDLRELQCANSKIISLQPLQKLKKLETIGANSCPIKSLKPVVKLHNLKKLELYNTKISSLDALKNLKNLEDLAISSTKIKNIRSLRTLKKLKKLLINNTSITSLDGIEDLTNLEILSLADTEIKTLTALRNLKNLKVLVLNGTKITSLEPLKNLPIEQLQCLQSKVPKKEVKSFKKTHPRCEVTASLAVPITYA